MSSLEMSTMIPNLKKLYGKKFRIDHERYMDRTPVKNTSAVSRLSTIPAPSTATV